MCRPTVASVEWLYATTSPILHYISLRYTQQYSCPDSFLQSLKGGGGMGKISVILVKNYFFMFLHKFNLHNLIYDSLKFQTSIINVQSFIRPFVNFYTIKYIIKGVFHTKFLNFHFLNISTYFLKLSSWHFFFILHKLWWTKLSIRFFIFHMLSRLKMKSIL